MWYVLALLVAPLAALAAADPQSEPQSEMGKAIEEFKVATRALGLRADSPRRSKEARKSVQFHGRLYHNFRNDFLDAVPKEVRQNGGDKNLLRRNQFGFNLSGPLVIPKIYDGRRTFFSVSYEGVRERIGRSYLRTVANALEREGDFSATVDQAGNPLPIYDPASTRPNPDYDPSLPVSTENLQYLRDPFPEGRIPQTRIDPLAAKALALYPMPNTNVGPFFRNNYFTVSPETNTANGVIVRIDHSIRDRHRINFSTSLSNGFQGAARYFQTAANSSGSDHLFQNRRASIDHVFTISPQTINTLSFYVSSDVSENISERVYFASELGVNIPGSDVFPVLSFSPYLSMGVSNPSGRNARNGFTFSDGFSTRLGKHNLRGVVQVSRLQVNSFVPLYPAGHFRFSSGLTSLPGITNTGLAFASYLLGLAEFGEVSVVQSPSYFRRTSASIFARDQYEIRPGLTFSIGANLAINGPRVEKYDRQSTVDLTAINPENGRPGALVAAGRDGHGRAFQPTIARLEPSASLAWNPFGDSKRTIRLSYSRSYSSIPVYSAQFGTQGFNGYAAYYSPNVQLNPAMKLSDGVPFLPPLPDLRPEAANYTVAHYITPGDEIPTTHGASASLESQLPASMVVTVGASLSGGKNLLVSNNNVNLNAIHPSALVYRDELNNEEFRRTLRPYPQYLGLDVYSSYPGGRYRRAASFVRLEKRTSTGLSLNVYYEFSKQEDDYSGPYGRQNFFDSQSEWSLTAYNSPHRLSLSYVYELPIGTNKPFLAYTDWRRVLVDGWSLSGISTVSSGLPLALRPQFNNTGGVISNLRVDVVPNVDPRVENPSPELWFNPAAFAHPADFTLGNGPRTHPFLRGPGSQNHDLSVSKRFAIATESTLEFTASGFNFINHGNWNDPDVVIGPADAPNVNAGRIIGSRGGRVIQLGLRLSF